MKRPHLWSRTDSGAVGGTAKSQVIRPQGAPAVGMFREVSLARSRQFVAAHLCLPARRERAEPTLFLVSELKATGKEWNLPRRSLPLRTFIESVLCRKWTSKNVVDREEPSSSRPKSTTSIPDSNSPELCMRPPRNVQGHAKLRRTTVPFVSWNSSSSSSTSWKREYRTPRGVS